jgi:hypothetical protein
MEFQLSGIEGAIALVELAAIALQLPLIDSFLLPDIYA